MDSRAGWAREAAWPLGRRGTFYPGDRRQGHRGMTVTGNTPFCGPQTEPGPEGLRCSLGVSPVTSSPCCGTHSHMHGHTHNHVCTHARTHRNTHICAHTHITTHTCTHSRVHACTHHTRVHTHVCTHAHTHTCTDDSDSYTKGHHQGPRPPAMRRPPPPTVLFLTVPAGAAPGC